MTTNQELMKKLDEAIKEENRWIKTGVPKEAEDHAHVVIAALKTARDMIPRGIDSAPKDGTEIWGYSNKWLVPMLMDFSSKESFEKDYGDPEYMEEGWYLSHRTDFDQPHEYTMEPTHWTPTPDKILEKLREGLE